MDNEPMVLVVFLIFALGIVVGTVGSCCYYENKIDSIKETCDKAWWAEHNRHVDFLEKHLLKETSK